MLEKQDMSFSFIKFPQDLFQRTTGQLSEGEWEKQAKADYWNAYLFIFYNKRPLVAV